MAKVYSGEYFAPIATYNVSIDQTGPYKRIILGNSVDDLLGDMSSFPLGRLVCWP